MPPVSSHVVVAVVNDEFTIKRLRVVCGTCELHPESPGFQPIRFNEGASAGNVWCRSWSSAEDAVSEHARPGGFALVAVSNFHVSYERGFNPKLRGRQVVIPSNNNVVRTNEAKSLGVKMAGPCS